jgi:hypothetical protein
LLHFRFCFWRQVVAPVWGLKLSLAGLFWLANPTGHNNAAGEPPALRRGEARPVRRRSGKKLFTSYYHGLPMSNPPCKLAVMKMKASRTSGAAPLGDAVGDPRPSSREAPSRARTRSSRRPFMADSRKRFGPVVSDKCAKKRDISAANCFY